MANARKITSKKLEKLQKDEKTRNMARRKAQKKGKSLLSDKPKFKTKGTRITKKIVKKRSSVK